MSIDAGTLFVNIVSNTQDLTSGLKKATLNVSTFTSKTSSKLSSWTQQNKQQLQVMGMALTAFGIGAGLAFKRFAEAAIAESSALEEATGKFMVVFSENAEHMDEVVQELTADFAMSTTEARRYLSSIQDLLVPMGVNASLASDMSEGMVKLSADLASFNDMPTVDVMESIQSALTGEYQTMKKFGVVLNEATVQAEVFRLGLAETKSEITASDKAQAAYNLILRDSKAAVGDMARTADSYANVSKKLSSIQADFLASTGKFFLPMMTKAKKGLIAWAEASGGVGEKAKTVALVVLHSLKALSNAFNGLKILASAAIRGLAEQIGLITKPLSLMLDGLVKLNVIDFNPIKGFIRSTREGLKETVDETVKINQSFDELIDKVQNTDATAILRIKKVTTSDAGEESEEGEDGGDGDATVKDALSYLTGYSAEEFENALGSFETITEMFADKKATLMGSMLDNALRLNKLGVLDEKDTEKQKLSLKKFGAQSSLQIMEGLGKKSKTLQKAQALAMQAMSAKETIINAWKAKTLAEATIPPPGGTIVGGILLGLGLAAAATQAAIAFQHGGITTGYGNEDSIPAMLRPREVVMPLEKLPDIIPKITTGGNDRQSPLDLEGDQDNMGGVIFNYNHYGDIRTEQDKEELFTEMEDRVLNAMRGAEA